MRNEILKYLGKTGEATAREIANALGYEFKDVIIELSDMANGGHLLREQNSSKTYIYFAPQYEDELEYTPDDLEFELSATRIERDIKAVRCEQLEQENKLLREIVDSASIQSKQFQMPSKQSTLTQLTGYHVQGDRVTLFFGKKLSARSVVIDTATLALFGKLAK